MTAMTKFSTADLPVPEIIGPYSEWPRREKPRARTPRRRRAIAYASGLAALGIFAHCAVPLLV